MFECQSPKNRLRNTRAISISLYRELGTKSCFTQEDGSQCSSDLFLTRIRVAVQTRQCYAKAQIPKFNH